MLNKKAIAAGVLVGIIAMLIIFIVLFRLDIMIANLITGGAEDQICFWSAGMSSLSKVGPKTVTDLYCNRNIVRVMMNSNDIPAANREKGVDFVYINKPIAPKLRENLDQWYGDEDTEADFDIKENKDRVLKYRLNEIMAKELKSCWGNLGRGTYNLFDQNLLPVEGPFKEGDSLPTKLLKSLQFWEIELMEVPKVCFICSTVIFENEVSSKFEGEVDLTPFLLNNPVKLATPEAISYYEFLEDDIKQSDFFRPKYTYTTDKIQAIVFLRMNLGSYLEQRGSKLATLKLSEIVSDRDYRADGKILEIDVPLLIPFDEVSDNCDKFA